MSEISYDQRQLQHRGPWPNGPWASSPHRATSPPVASCGPYATADTHIAVLNEAEKIGFTRG